MEDILRKMAGIEIKISGKEGNVKAKVASEYVTKEGKVYKIREMSLSETQLRSILDIILKGE